jgi:hypothetical protein
MSRSQKDGKTVVKRKKFSGDLKFEAGDEPVDLFAYRLAQRLFWYQAVHGGNDTLQTLYERIRKLRKERNLK